MYPEKAIFQTCDPSKHAILEQSFQMAWTSCALNESRPAVLENLNLDRS